MAEQKTELKTHQDVRSAVAGDRVAYGIPSSLMES